MIRYILYSLASGSNPYLFEILYYCLFNISNYNRPIDVYNVNPFLVYYCLYNLPSRPNPYPLEVSNTGNYYCSISFSAFNRSI